MAVHSPVVNPIGLVVADQLKRAGAVVALVDESGYLERLGSKAAGRAAERAALWRQFCARHETPMALVNLADPQRHPEDIEALLTQRQAVR